MKPLTLYLRREPTTDSTWLKYGTGERYDIQAYGDKDATDPVGRFIWSNTKPRKGCKTVVLNCFRWRVVWLSDAKRS